MPAPVTVALTRGLVLLLLVGLAAFAALTPARAQDLPGPLYVIEGLVEDGAGNALEGARVQLVHAPGGALVANETTDADGRYRFPLVEAGAYHVSAGHDCCLRASVDVSAGGPTPLVPAPTLRLAPMEPAAGGDPVRLSGVVRSTQDGAAVALVDLVVESYYGAECKAGGACFSGYQSFYLETDALGGFELDVNRGRASLRAQREDFDATRGGFSMAADRAVEVPLRPAEDRTLRVFGVLQSSDGGAVADGWVSVGPSSDACPPNADCAYPTTVPAPSDEPSWSHEPSGPLYNSTQTDPNGSWSMRVVEGSLRLHAFATDHLEAHRSAEGAAGGEVRVDLTLERIPPDTVTVKGRVTDRSSGQAVAGVGVSLENQKWGTHAYGVTDEDGRYELRTKPGYTILTVRSDSFYGCAEPATMAPDGVALSVARPCTSEQTGPGYYPAVVSFDAPAGASIERDVRLLPRPAPESEFVGYVVNASSRTGIAGAVVTFYNEDTRDWGSATTDADGSYRIRLHAGYYSVRAWAEGYFDGVANGEVGARATERLDLALVAGEKRYGAWAMGGYAVAEGGRGGTPHDEGPPLPAEGQQAYEGGPGGLGPYGAGAPAAAKADALGLLVGLAVVACLPVAMRRRA